METQNKSVIVFCGLFSYNPDEADKLFPLSRYHDFEDFFEKDNEIKVLKHIFYPNFSNLIISKKCHSLPGSGECLFRHLILRDISNFKELLFVPETDETVKFSISKVDLFLFPEIISPSGYEKMGIYAFHVKLNEDCQEHGKISSFIHRFRVFESSNHIRCADEQFSTMTFIENKILCHPVSNEIVANIMGNKLKTFTVINTKKKIDNLDQNLFDIGTAQLVINGTGEHQTLNTKELYQEIIQSNVVSVYSNWKALALFDSFTVIGTELSDISKTWCTTYLLIYIHCLKLKFYLFHINSELSRLKGLPRGTGQLRKNFIEFISRNNFSSVSYNILPNKLYRTIHSSLDIKEEVEDLEKKITKMNALINERNEHRLNRLVFLLALLGVISVIFHSSEFIMRVFEINEHYYPQLGLLISIIIISIVSFYFLSLKKKRR